MKVATVIGANGTMGRSVSAILASFGNMKVYMVGTFLGEGSSGCRACRWVCKGFKHKKELHSCQL